MFAANVTDYIRLLTQEHIKLILNDTLEGESEHRRRIAEYRRKLAELGVSYDAVTGRWVEERELAQA